MTNPQNVQNRVTLEDEAFVLSSLEPDQLAEAKRTRVPRRILKGRELMVLWFLRIYLLFMVAVVIYQALSGAR
jgi:hypothetical protein